MDNFIFIAMIIVIIVVITTTPNSNHHCKNTVYAAAFRQGSLIPEVHRRNLSRSQASRLASTKTTTTTMMTILMKSSDNDDEDSNYYDDDDNDENNNNNNNNEGLTAGSRSEDASDDNSAQIIRLVIGVDNINNNNDATSTTMTKKSSSTTHPTPPSPSHSIQNDNNNENINNKTTPLVVTKPTTALLTDSPPSPSPPSSSSSFGNRNTNGIIIISTTPVVRTTALATVSSISKSPRVSSSPSSSSSSSYALMMTSVKTLSSSRSIDKSEKSSKGIDLRAQNRKPSVAINAMAQLLRNIFSRYKKEIIPDKPVYVTMDLLMLKVKSTIEREGILETVIALLIEWKDSRFLWEPNDYDNVTVLAFDSYRLWLPDIAMTNSADHLYTLSRDGRFIVRVSHDGHLKFVPTGTARTWCALNLQDFPFDIQTCSIDFESWSLDNTMMQFNETATLLVDDSFSSQQWTLCDHNTKVYDHHYYTGETFTCLRYEFVIKRKSTFYVVNLIFPCTTLSFIQLLAFIIPSTRSTSDRIAFGTTNLLTLVVFQTIVTAEMPKSNQFTALSKYVISLIVISSFGIMQSIFVERMLHIATHPPPRFLFWLLQHISPFLTILWQQPIASQNDDPLAVAPEMPPSASFSSTNYNNNNNNNNNNRAPRMRKSSSSSSSSSSSYSSTTTTNNNFKRNSRRKQSTEIIEENDEENICEACDNIDIEQEAMSCHREKAPRKRSITFSSDLDYHGGGGRKLSAAAAAQFDPSSSGQSPLIRRSSNNNKKMSSIVSIKTGILAGSSLLATAAVMHGKTKPPKRRETQAAHLKKEFNEQQALYGNSRAFFNANNNYTAINYPPRFAPYDETSTSTCPATYIDEDPTTTIIGSNNRRNSSLLQQQQQQNSPIKNKTTTTEITITATTTTTTIDTANTINRTTPQKLSPFVAAGEPTISISNKVSPMMIMSPLLATTPIIVPNNNNNSSSSKRSSVLLSAEVNNAAKMTNSGINSSQQQEDHDNKINNLRFEHHQQQQDEKSPNKISTGVEEHQPMSVDGITIIKAAELTMHDEQQQQQQQQVPRHRIKSSSSSTSSPSSFHNHHHHQHHQKQQQQQQKVSHSRSKATVDTATSWLFKQPSNDELWAELVTRIDALTLGICAVLILLLPASLFLPLALREDSRCQHVVDHNRS